MQSVHLAMDSRYPTYRTANVAEKVLRRAEIAKVSHYYGILALEVLSRISQILITNL